jgi:hypothetical protein
MTGADGRQPVLAEEHFVKQSPWDELAAERENMIARANAYADLGLGVHADMLAAGGPVPPLVRSAPLIIDADVGSEPGDAVALIVAATAVPELALVLTCDEVDGERARLARYLLDLAGRPEVPVVAGQQASQPPLFSADGLVPAAVPKQPGTHLDGWFARQHPSSMQHDALTLSAALQLPFVDFGLRGIAFDEAGRITVRRDSSSEAAGTLAFVSRRVHYAPFQDWLARHLAPPDAPSDVD